MAQAYASAIIEAPVETVWATIRDFGALAAWHPALSSSEIEQGDPPDRVGCIRSLQLHGGGGARERLLMLDDSRYSFSYNFETPAFPVGNYVSTLELIPVTNGDATFARWSATFDEQPEDAGKYVDIVSNAVFAVGLAALADKLRGAASPVVHTERWEGSRPAKVFCSSVIPAAASGVWREVRNFAGMSGWHPAISDMHMMDGARSDQVSGVRSFRFGDGLLEEQLTRLSDADRSLGYRINKSGQPWLNYRSEVRLHDVTSSGECFAVWTADWTASAHDDVQLIPFVHHEVFQRAFDTLGAKLVA
ncbi:MULTISPECIES: SRPBCC family protein [unclassified Acidisoma]|jgi:hypothetical protein|uniref:SRPBCC family protein n=1 Tax=unclassified Acidisoma TaxID=2634065 RepID=UPI00131B04D0|nr:MULTISPECIES: SRPBCC family protein [unclassified Acidisoma]